MKNKNVFISCIIKVIVAIVFAIFCLLGIFEKLDYRLYDALIKLRKEPVQNPNVMLVKIDGPSIKQ